ncbi:RNA-binding cell elongation regulator Jag/EloR [uncultured Clostridium sp.]|jgi:spoIIIJ-associated protein|uniref:RNA-binding cell elongation regulator Jag/EloR n=1 Tax=uncultured Clostridium sp. TaxID=59620 RepID=UPI0026233268|nr:RNA-binding cell elongation regulator Jag/EloR [uncultured Clostridium sp.]
MKTIEFTGKTVEDALENALSELKVSKDKVEYTITDEGSKGFLGFLGSKPAKVRITIKKNPLEECELFLRGILLKIGVELEILVKEESDKVFIDVKGEEVGTIIGYRGETLDAIQYLLNIFINKANKGIYKKVILDAGSYRVKREETLRRLALKTAYKVKKYGRSMKFEPMNPYERKIIHSALQEDNKITTKSEGQEPFRGIVVNVR